MRLGAVACLLMLSSAVSIMLTDALKLLGVMAIDGGVVEEDDYVSKAASLRDRLTAR